MIEEFDLQTYAALCFVAAEWSFFAGPFDVGGVWVGWANALGEKLQAAGPLDPEHRETIAKRVAKALPPA